MISGIQYGLTRAEYLSLRAPYLPDDRKIVFVLESPPKSGLYFYNPQGRISESLFNGMMKDVLQMKPESKAAPVNHEELSRGERNQRILRDLPTLVDELRQYVGPATRVVLVKANICELLEPILISHGFPVTNRGTKIPFPSHGQQPKFREMVRRVLGVT